MVSAITDGGLPLLSKGVYDYNVLHQTTRLNTVDVWTHKSTSLESTSPKTWLIFIHGGGWRDPEVDSAAFEPAMRLLWNSFGDSRIAGFASINYRLSPHPHHERLPSSPDDPSRNAVHPDHIKDVENALLYLDKAHRISDGYILAGHSAGATLAFQVKASELPRPLAVVGVAGIYDLGLLIQNHRDQPIYETFLRGAFPNETTWNDVSPTLSEKTDLLWREAKLVVISHSQDDGLVEVAQAEKMFERARVLILDSSSLRFVEAEGQHDAMWEEGKPLAEVISKTLNLLDGFQ